MTKETQNPQLNIPVVNGSALIAQFDGWEKSIYENLPNKVYKENYTIGIPLDQLNYHENWNLLIPVIEKIESIKTKNNTTIFHFFYFIGQVPYGYKKSDPKTTFIDEEKAPFERGNSAHGLLCGRALRTMPAHGFL